MNKSQTLEQYRARIMSVLDYLWRNIERDTDMNTLAEVAHFSPYHFHRVYREIMRETVYQTVKRLRLHHAAGLLLRTHDSVEKIAEKAHYGSVAAFTRAFARAYGVAPARYRQGRRELYQPPLRLPQQQKEYAMKAHVDLLTVPNIELAGLPHKGDYLTIGATFEKVFIKAQSLQLLGPNTRSIGVYYDDPFSCEADSLRSHACITATQDQAAQSEMDPITVGGGLHGVLEFKGPYSELEEAYRWLYGEWLPNSGMEAADAPPFEEYMNDPKTVPATELVTKIYLPLAS